MNALRGLAFSAVLTFVAGGCASGGAGGGAGAGDPLAAALAQARADATGRDLPEGIPPRDNAQTRAADAQLSRAEGAADAAEREGFYLQAIEQAEAGIAADPENPKSWFQSGVAHLGLGRLAEADSAFTVAERIHPQYWYDIVGLREQTWIEKYNASTTLLGAGDVPGAIAAMEEADAIYRERPEAMLQLGALYAQGEQLDLAIDAFQRSIETIQGPFREIQEAETLVNWDENARIATLNLAQLLSSAGRDEEAVVAYRSYLEGDEGNLGVTANLAAVLSRLGRADEAEALFNALLSRPGLSAEDYFYAGIGLFQAGNYGASARAFGEAQTRNPNSRDAAYNRAQALYMAATEAEGEATAEQWGALETAATELLEVDPNNENAYRLLAQSIVRQGSRDQEAVAVLERMQALPFEIVDTQLQPVAGGGGVLQGGVRTMAAAAGTEVRLRFSFYDGQGELLGTAESEVQIGETDTVTPFRVEFRSGSEVSAFRYEVLD